MDLSVLIPARNEQWLARTIADVLEHAKGETEIIAVLDGVWADPPIPDHPRVTLLRQGASIGQRAAVNQAARLAQGRYVMKLDAHCAVADGFDAELVRAGDELGHDATQIPRMRNLHVFDWVCGACGKRTYQGPKPARCACGGEAFTQDVVWIAKESPITDFARFDRDLHFQYWRSSREQGRRVHGYGHRPEAQSDIADVLGSVGACFVMRRERFVELGGLDERHGSWGQFGVEVALKSWLSGGRQVVNKRTWFAHLFRTQDGFKFPYELSQRQVDQARAHSRYLWIDGTWPLATRPLSWLLKKFAPVPDWSDEAIAALPDLPKAVTRKTPAPSAPTVGIVYYSDCRGDETILSAVRQQIQRGANGHQIVSATLKPLDFGRNIVLDLERGYLAMFRQILAGLEALDTDVAFFAEHDVIYHPTQWTFRPPRDDVYFYNLNCWKVDAATGRAVTYETKQTSQLCANRRLLVAHYRARVARVERDGFSRAMGFEPGSHRRPERIDDVASDVWRSPVPNIDIRHGQNLTASRWSPAEFRSQRNCRGWREAEDVPGWGRTAGRFPEFLAEVSHGAR